MCKEKQGMYELEISLKNKNIIQHPCTWTLNNINLILKKEGLVTPY